MAISLQAVNGGGKCNFEQTNVPIDTVPAISIGTPEQSLHTGSVSAFVPAFSNPKAIGKGEELAVFADTLAKAAPKAPKANTWRTGVPAKKEKVKTKPA